MGYLKSETESEELVQEVFSIIWEKRASLKEELSFKSFIFTIAFNIIKRHFRARNYLLEYFKSSSTDISDSETIEEISYNSLYHHIIDLVRRLPKRRREVFIKSRFEGLSIQEISKELNISHKTVENHLTDALKYVRFHLRLEGLPFILLFELFLSK